jgi:hypothetical protein
MNKLETSSVLYVCLSLHFWLADIDTIMHTATHLLVSESESELGIDMTYYDFEEAYG